MSRLKTSLGMRFDLSAHRVLNIDDLMFEILLFLPPESVYKLILVSKRWLQIISDPFFRHVYLTKWKPRFELLGVFICKAKNAGIFKYELRSSYHKPSLLRCPSRTSLADEIESLKKLGHYVDSSNGFILYNSGYQKTDYYLWNTNARYLYQLPLPSVHFGTCCTSLIIEDCPDKEFSFKVIRAERVHFSNQQTTKLKVEIFSSKTNTWSYSELTCPEPLSLECKGKVIGGVIYWYAEGGNVAIYDTNSNENRVDLIKLPKFYCHDEKAMGSSADGCLQYGRSSKTILDIWKLEKVNGMFQWKFQHKLNFKVIWMSRNGEDSKEEVEKLLAFPIRNENHTISKRDTSTIWKMKKEKQSVPYGTCAMSCHSFDDLGLPFFLFDIERSRLSRKIGRKLLCHYVSC